MSAPDVSHACAYVGDLWGGHEHHTMTQTSDHSSNSEARAFIINIVLNTFIIIILRIIPPRT